MRRSLATAGACPLHSCREPGAHPTRCTATDQARDKRWLRVKRGFSRGSVCPGLRPSWFDIRQPKTSAAAASPPSPSIPSSCPVTRALLSNLDEQQPPPAPVPSGAPWCPSPSGSSCASRPFSSCLGILVSPLALCPPLRHPSCPPLCREEAEGRQPACRSGAPSPVTGKQESAWFWKGVGVQGRGPRTGAGESEGATSPDTSPQSDGSSHTRTWTSHV